METSVCYTDYKVAYMSSDEGKWIRRIRELKTQFPDLVTIDYEPETNDRCICAKFPTDWLKIQPPRRLTMTDEQRAAAAERMKNAFKNSVTNRKAETE